MVIKYQVRHCNLLGITKINFNCHEQNRRKTSVRMQHFNCPKQAHWRNHIIRDQPTLFFTLSCITSAPWLKDVLRHHRHKYLDNFIIIHLIIILCVCVFLSDFKIGLIDKIFSGNFLWEFLVTFLKNFTSQFYSDWFALLLSESFCL